MKNNLTKKKAKRDILPFFIPMAGCPYRCIYCDQQAVSGEAAPVSPEHIHKIIAGLPEDSLYEVAYYGGTFSALSEVKQQEYLSAILPFIEKGTVSAVRVSTRPDAIDEHKLAFLAENHVETVELGIQSFDSAVLIASGRFYTPEEAEEACRLVLSQGLNLGIQLMTGLPKDSYERSLSSMRKALSLHCQMIRIYPTLVIKKTPLAALWAKGDYRPQSLDDAVTCCRDMLALAHRQGVPVIRMGLNPSLSIESSVLDGPYHPAFGHCVRSALKQRQLEILLLGEEVGEKVTLAAPPGEIPLLAGQEKQNRHWLKSKFGAEAVLAEDRTLSEGAIALYRKDGSRKNLEYHDFLDIYCGMLPE